MKKDMQNKKGNLCGKEKGMINNNSNATLGLSPELARSIETIYRNAVEKRTSSSSEDAMELSDESLDQPGSFLIVGTSPRKGGTTALPKANTMVRSLMQLDEKQMEMTAEEKAEKLIREAELAKAKMFPPKGELNAKQFELIAKVDQDYEIVGNHLGSGMQEKIVKGEYVDFGKLLPKDRILTEEDGRMELIVKNSPVKG